MLAASDFHLVRLLSGRIVLVGADQVDEDVFERRAHRRELAEERRRASAS